MPAVPYNVRQVAPTGEQLSAWKADWDRQVVSGPCPGCDDDMVADLGTVIVEMGIDVPSPRVKTLRIMCSCGEDHPSEAGSKQSCGAFWFALITEESVKAQRDPKAVLVANAVRGAQDSAESNLRSAAEKWIAGVAALLGVFGIATTIGGGKDLSAISDAPIALPFGLVSARILAGVLSGLALTIAVASIICSYLAAYGWPKVWNLKNEGEAIAWYDGRLARVGRTAAQMRWGVALATVSVALLASVAGIAWFGPAGAEPTVKVSLKDESVRCGQLLSTGKSEGVRLRGKDGLVVTVAMDQISKVGAADSCE